MSDKSPQLVVTSFNGKQHFAVELFPSSTIEPSLFKELARVTIPEDLLELPLSTLARLWQNGGLK